MTGNTAAGGTVAPKRRFNQDDAAARSSSEPAVNGYPGASEAADSAARITSGVGSTGVPTDRSTMPSGCRRARSAAGASRSQGKSGSEVTASSGWAAGWWTSSVLDLVGVDVGGKRSDDRVVLVDLAHL